MDWSSIGSFLNHGVHHVLEGWDHLLFAAALVLALSSFWEVFKVIGVFTVAHSITVTWTALRGAPVLPPSIVEPVIAGSIVVVALVLWCWVAFGLLGLLSGIVLLAATHFYSPRDHIPRSSRNSTANHRLARTVRWIWAL